MNLPENHEIINANFYNMIDRQLKNNEPFAYMFKGITGSGKTELLKIIANHIPGSKIISLPDAWKDYFEILCSAYTDKSEALDRRFDRYKQPIVLIDDMGAELELHDNACKFTTTVLHTLYDSYMKHKGRGNYKYIITSNTSSKQDREAYGDRIYDRLLEIFTIVNFPAKSFREASSKRIDLSKY